MLWMILTLMTVVAAVGLAIPLIRRRDAVAAERNEAVGVLKAQLGEIEAQAAAGALESAEAEALKSDLKRRVLAEGRRSEGEARPLADRTLVYVALGIAAIVTLAGTGLYLAIGKPNVPASPAVAGAGGTDALPPGHPGGDAVASIAELEAKLKQQPNNAEGWRVLGWSYLQTGRNAEAAAAYGKAAALEPGNAEYQSALGEATVLAEDGQVTPAAEAAFRRAVAADPADPRARYYLAVAKDQAGQHEAAMDDWIALLKSAEPGAPWAGQVRDFVEKVAAERNIDISHRLPPLQTAQAGPPPGPSQDQMTAAQGMDPAQRQAMIEGMVNGLAERLKANPRDLDGWKRLMRARMVLGQADLAAAAYRDASQVFAGAPVQQQALRRAAVELGVPVS